MRQLVHGLLDLILPPICLACDGPIGAGDTRRLVCRRCRARLRPPPPPNCDRCSAPLLRTGRVALAGACPECQDWPLELVAARTAFLMHPPADRIVHQLKYRGWAALADVMAEPMARALLTSEVARAATLVVPVPTTASRVRERGYNQAELIARAVATALERECAPILERTSSKSTQTTLQPAARTANVAGAFRARLDAAKRIADAHILIIDDVLTTGATVIECTNTLVGAGAHSVSVLTFARAFDTRRLFGT